MIPKTEGIKPKRGGKKVKKELSDDSSGNNDLSDSEKDKIEQKDQKPKRGRKVIEKSPSESPQKDEENIKTGDIPDGLPDNPESGKNDLKTAKKRKTKAKPAKK